MDIAALASAMRLGLDGGNVVDSLSRAMPYSACVWHAITCRPVLNVRNTRLGTMNFFSSIGFLAFD